MNDAGAEFGLGEYAALTGDYAKSISWFQKAADQACACGSAVQDYKRSVLWYQRASLAKQAASDWLKTHGAASR
jgi:TPR repeat protein